MITWTKRLNWMTDKEYEAIRFYFGVICDYDITWDNDEEYEKWCKRVLAED